MFRTAILLIPICILFACKPAKKDLASDEEIGVEDFIASFPARSLPYVLTDTQLMKKYGDSSRINAKIISKFLPDSVFRPDFRKGDKVVYHALGSVKADEGESYLFIRASVTGKSLAYVACFDSEGKFRVAMPVIKADGQRGVSSDMLMDGRLTITRNRNRRSSDGQLVYSKDAFVYNSAGVFTLVMTESNETVGETEIYDPIDTLPRTNPLSGNYVQGKRNFVTVRDGRASNRLLFFIHMERDGAECTGELKGELDIVKPGLAQYSRADDHCTLEFSFKGNSLSVRELEACGNHRSVRCEFAGNYPKRKEARKKTGITSGKK
jgi:hypothetical protein